MLGELSVGFADEEIVMALLDTTVEFRKGRSSARDSPDFLIIVLAPVDYN